MNTETEKLEAYTNMSRMVRKTKQIVMLYDGTIRYVQQAKSAIEDGRIEDRFNALTKACDVIIGLQLSLDFDNGGEIAKLLYDYYAGLDMRLLSIHQSESKEMCDLCIKHLKMMRDAWEEVDNNQGSEIEAKQAKNSPDSVHLSSDENSEASSSQDGGEVDFSDPNVTEALEQAAISVSMSA